MHFQQQLWGVAALLAASIPGCTDQETSPLQTLTGHPSSAPVPSARTPSSAEAALSDPFLQSASRASFPEDGNLFKIALVDLNGDDQNEALVYAYGPMVCGSGGCNLLVLTRDGAAYRILTQTSVTQAPIKVLENVSNGWRDLSVGVSGGGAKAQRVRLRFDGKSYPTNPTVLDPLDTIEGDEGRILIDYPLDGQPLTQSKE